MLMMVSIVFEATKTRLSDAKKDEHLRIRDERGEKRWPAQHIVRSVLGIRRAEDEADGRQKN